MLDYSPLLQPTPSRLTITASGGNFAITLLGEPGRQYSILTSTNLSIWTERTNFITSSDTVQISDPAGTQAARFYRAVTY